MFDASMVDLGMWWNTLFTCSVFQRFTQSFQVVVFVQLRLALKWVVLTVPQSTAGAGLCIFLRQRSPGTLMTSDCLVIGPRLRLVVGRAFCCSAPGLGPNAAGEFLSRRIADAVPGPARDIFDAPLPGPAELW
jgi:hypothetical protein